MTLKDNYYPIPNVGFGSTAGIYSPGVVIFRDQLDNACTELPVEQRRVVSVISVAAPRWPALSEDGMSLRRKTDLEDLREKIRLVYRIAAHYGKTHLVLGTPDLFSVYTVPAVLMLRAIVTQGLWDAAVMVVRRHRLRARCGTFC